MLTTARPLVQAHQISELKRLSSRLALAFAKSIETRNLVENEDVAGAPATSELSTILLPTKVRFILRGFGVIISEAL